LFGELSGNCYSTDRYEANPGCRLRPKSPRSLRTHGHGMFGGLGHKRYLGDPSNARGTLVGECGVLRNPSSCLLSQSLSWAPHDLMFHCYTASPRPIATNFSRPSKSAGSNAITPLIIPKLGVCIIRCCSSVQLMPKNRMGPFIPLYKEIRTTLVRLQLGHTGALPRL
jgi:hypothetical protein